MFCNKCGKKIDNNAKFCNYCGNIVSNNVLNNQQINNTNKIKKKFYQRWWFWLIIIIIILAAFWGIIFSNIENSSIYTALILLASPESLGCIFFSKSNLVFKIICSLFCITYLDISSKLSPPHFRLELYTLGFFITFNLYYNHL